MSILTRSEEFLLLSILRLGDNAYGVTIRNDLKEKSGKTWAFGALFVSLDRMSQKGYVTSFLSEPTHERGGRSKRLYQVTTHGLSALQNTKQVHRSMWNGIPSIEINNNSD